MTPERRTEEKFCDVFKNLVLVVDLFRYKRKGVGRILPSYK